MLRPQLKSVIKNLEVLFNLLYCVILLKQYRIDSWAFTHLGFFYPLRHMIQWQEILAFANHWLKWKDMESKLIREVSEDKKELMEEQKMF